MAKKSISQNTTRESTHYIVGIGASAGGMEAIHEVFENMPADTGFSFVVVQHLSPDHKSLMPELLAKHTAMQVFEAEDGMQVGKDCVYVLPNKKIMSIQKGRLKLVEKIRDRLPNTAIDHFFESLARDQRSNAVAVILSGSGTDGSRGIDCIKKENGLVIVQDPLTAAFDGMPNSAVTSGLADLILPPDMIGEEMVSLLRQNGSGHYHQLIKPSEALVLQKILLLIERATRHDFGAYKTPTIYRRMAKRMSEVGIPNIEEYYRFLQNNPGEITSLYKEFLINVTKFFRDSEAFSALKSNAFPNILSDKEAGDTVKIWVAACSTGEEAYSIAMLVREYLDSKKILNLNVKVFASDVDLDALEIASKGSYPDTIKNDVSPELLMKYFSLDGKQYIVSPALRKMVVFAQHDLLKDPPFSRVDLVSCRNMLIYINSALQKTIMKKFHFALNLNGYLLLGPSENIGILKEHMQEIERKWKLFQCISKSRDYEKDTIYTPFEIKSFAPPRPAYGNKNAINNIGEVFKDTLLEQHRYAGILLDKEFNVKHAIGEFNKYFRFPDGNFNLNILKLVSAELALPLGIGLRKAIQDQEKVILSNVKIFDNETLRYVDITIKPWLQSKEYALPFLFVVLEETKLNKKPPTEFVVPTYLDDNSQNQELELELRETRQGLQAVIAEMESVNEELQSQAEEMVSTNEELQSTNEELQSLNEELYTVSAEHQLKIKELLELNDDLNNYFKNSNIGQILVDRKLIVRRFSPAATLIVNLIESDLGRSILDITTNIKHIDLPNNIKAVLKTSEPIEKEIHLNDGRYYSLRINPFMRSDKTVDGVVINFIDVTESRRLTSTLEGVLNSSSSGIIAKKAVYNSQKEIIDFEYTCVNLAAEKILGIPAPDMLGKGMMQLPHNMESIHFDVFKQVTVTGESISFDFFDTPRHRWYHVVNVKMLDGVVTTFTDITEDKNMAVLLSKNFETLKSTSESLAATNVQLERSNLDLLQFASVASHDLKEPLRKIQVFGNMLHARMKEQFQPDDLNYLNKIIAASLRMQTLIEDVLIFSQLSNSELPRTDTNLNQIVSQIIEDLEVAIQDKNALLDIGKLPIVKAVPGQMRQLFQNLITNALKFCDKPKPVIKISIRDVADAVPDDLDINPEHFVCITVEDNGIGFENQYRDRIFGMFQRLGGRNYEGNGIGLSIAKKIVENHQGFMFAHGVPNVGATFSVVLPLVG